MAAGTLDFTIEQGATFNLLLTWEINDVAVNLTGYTARLAARVDVEDTEVILSMTTVNGAITLGGVLGTISLNQTATQTTLLAPGTYVYDLELVSGSTITRLVQGSFVVRGEVTR
jgi:hypothetical protein